MTTALFEMSADGRLLRQHLRDVSVGAIVEYSELSKIIGRTVDGSFSPLRSALNALLRHHRIVFASVRGTGLLRLNDNQIVSASDSDLDRIRRLSRRSVVKITAIKDYAALSPQQQIAHSTKLSLFTAFAAMSADQGQRQVAAAASGRAGQLPIAETLRAFLPACSNEVMP